MAAVAAALFEELLLVLVPLTPAPVLLAGAGCLLLLLPEAAVPLLLLWP